MPSPGKGRLRWWVVTGLAFVSSGLLAGCSPPVSVISSNPVPTYCQASPPDVLSRPQSVPVGSGSRTWTAADDYALHAYAAQHPDVYTEPISGSDGHLYVGFSADAKGHLQELRRVMPDPTIVRAYCSGYSNRQLAQAQARIMGDIPFWRRDGIEVQGADAGGLPDMLVGVMVNKPTQNTLDLIRARYGPIVGHVEAGPAPNFDDGLSRGLPTPSGRWFPSRTTLITDLVSIVTSP